MKLAGDGAHEDPSRLVRIYIHHSIPIHMLGIAAAIATYVPNPWISWGALAVAFSIWWSAEAMIKRHYRGICETCLDQIPDRGSEEAEQRDRTLRATHFLVNHEKWFGWGPAIVLVVAVVLTLTLKVQGLTLAYVLPTIGINGWAIRLMVHHGRLQPWCPYCRTDGGGDEVECVPDPEPVMVKTF